MPAFMEMSTHPFAALFLWHGKCWPLSLTHKSLRFPSTIDHPDHHLTTTHANARGASPEKALRAFYMVFNFVHNQREMASQSHFYLTVRELRQLWRGEAVARNPVMLRWFSTQCIHFSGGLTTNWPLLICHRFMDESILVSIRPIVFSLIIIVFLICARGAAG